MDRVCSMNWILLPAEVLCSSTARLSIFGIVLVAALLSANAGEISKEKAAILIAIAVLAGLGLGCFSAKNFRKQAFDMPKKPKASTATQGKVARM